jgi:hypothetical protein
MRLNCLAVLNVPTDEGKPHYDDELGRGGKWIQRLTNFGTAYKFILNLMVCYRIDSKVLCCLLTN